MILYMFEPFLKSILERVYSVLLFWVFCLIIGLFVCFLFSLLICNVWSTPIKLHWSTIPYHPRLIKSKAWLWYLSSSCSPRCAIGMCMISNFFVYTTLHIKLHLLDRLQQVPSWRIEDGERWDFVVRTQRWRNVWTPAYHLWASWRSITVVSEQLLQRKYLTN